MKPVNEKGEKKNSRFLNVKASGTYSYRHDSKG
jgi:hypothetical protein